MQSLILHHTITQIPFQVNTIVHISGVHTLLLNKLSHLSEKLKTAPFSALHAFPHKLVTQKPSYSARVLAYEDIVTQFIYITDIRY